MQSLGQRLREERERRGLSAEKVAATLRIDPRYLEAIERDDHESLPGGFFYRSFVRQYARLLDLPESIYAGELDRALEAERAHTSSQLQTLADRHIDVPPMPTGMRDRAAETRRWVIRLVMLVLVVVGATGLYKLYLGWRLSEPETSASAVVTPPVQLPPSMMPSPTAAPTAAAETAGTVSPTPTAEPAAQAPTPTPPPAAQSPAVEGSIRVTVSARQLVWVDVVADGKRVLMRAMEAGESQSFGANEAIRIRTGNAGGLGLTYNGKPLEPVGPVGQVRTVVFTPKGYDVVQPQPKVTTEPAQQPPPAPPGV